MTDPIDLDHLERYVCGDAGLRAEVLGLFVEQTRLMLDRLVVDAEDEAWRDAAHALKGAARGVGAWAVGDLAEEAEGLVAGAPEKVARRKLTRNALAACLDVAIGRAQSIADQAA